MMIQFDYSEQVPVRDYQEHSGVYLEDNSSSGTKLLKIRWVQRISTEEIMKHPWLQEIYQLKNRKRLTWRQSLRWTSWS